MKSRYLCRLSAFALCLALSLAAALATSPAAAKPAFSVKHKVTCSHCHTKPPILNDVGQKFLDSGFKLAVPEEPEKAPEGAKASKTDKAD